VKVNEIFEIKAVPEIKGGSVLQEAIVNCNVTEFFRQTDVGTQIFSNFASESMSLEKTNTLAPSVQVDDKRTTQVTDYYGVASFHMKLLRGAHHLEAAVICECEGVKSTLSRPFLISNKLRTITLLTDFS
jgi:hypothetical protein